jgi:hypothetical protein
MLLVPDAADYAFDDLFVEDEYDIPVDRRPGPVCLCPAGDVSLHDFVLEIRRPLRDPP